MRAVRGEHTGTSHRTTDSAAAHLPGDCNVAMVRLSRHARGCRETTCACVRGRTNHKIEAAGSTAPVARQSLNWELPFYFGNIEAGLERHEETTRALIETQEDDGRWRYDPTTESGNAHGGSGDTVLGICAHFAFILLKHARISGNENSLNAGLKALKGMDRFKIARGTHVSEYSLKTRLCLPQQCRGRVC